ncbi:hypothetical protein CYJ73_02540 [Gordonia terrae]|uniref:Uncharacterized protein n=1 Tax=Gordonia terrae TaxID=2055 RepID=A0A2I1REL2_9ACTN|nr:hypothetical protein CYJ73_02540 [Gordonia terrae]
MKQRGRLARPTLVPEERACERHEGFRNLGRQTLRDAPSASSGRSSGIRGVTRPPQAPAAPQGSEGVASIG